MELLTLALVPLALVASATTSATVSTTVSYETIVKMAKYRYHLKHKD
jgi:hypothetical protein